MWNGKWFRIYFDSNRIVLFFYISDYGTTSIYSISISIIYLYQSVVFLFLFILDHIIYKSPLPFKQKIIFNCYSMAARHQCLVQFKYHCLICWVFFFSSNFISNSECMRWMRWNKERIVEINNLSWTSIHFKMLLSFLYSPV